MDPAYQHYFDRLAGKDVPLLADEPHCGFYRMRWREKNGPVTYRPVAYFMVDRRMLCLLGDQELNDLRMREIWPSCEPVPEDQWRAVAEDGKPWPDEDAEVRRQSNAAPADELEALRDQINSAAAFVDEYKNIDSDEHEKRAQSLRSRLLELHRHADKRRETLKKPHYEAGKAVDTAWQPLVKAAKAAADAIAAAMGKWETKKAQEAREIAAANDAAGLTGTGFSAPGPADKVKGAYGRAASVQPVKVVTIVDQDAVYQHFKGHIDVFNVLQQLARQAALDNINVPGVKIEEEMRVR